MKITKILLLACTLIFVNHSHAEVVFLADTGFIVKNKIKVTTSKEETWTLFTSQVDQWWPSDHTWWGEASTLTIDTFAGGCFCEKYENNSAEHMRITFVQPSKLMRMTGGLGPLQGMGMYGALEWQFIDNEYGTEVTMTYKVNGINPSGFKDLAPIVDKVQALQISGLAKLIADKKRAD